MLSFFSIPSNTLANLDFIYLSKFSASVYESKLPILINVGVDDMRGVPMRGVLKTSPIEPLPLDSGTNTLNFSILL